MNPTDRSVVLRAPSPRKKQLKMASSTTTLRWLVLGLLAGSPLQANNYVKITRTTLPQCQASVVTCEPHGWMTRSSAVTGTSTSAAIGVREIVYLPSALSIYPEDADADGEGALDDHHFVSLLADRGFTVHILRPNLDRSPASTAVSADPTTALHQLYLEALTQFVSLRVRTHRVPASCLCLLADELAAPRLLAYLADVALPIASTTRANIGAAVLIDPPPLLPLHTLSGRRRLLKSRYAEPLLSPAAHRRVVAPHASQRAAVAVWKSTFRSLHGDGTGRVAQALLALLRSDPPTPSLSLSSVDDEEEGVDTSTSSPPTPPLPPTESTTAVEEMLLAEELRMLVRDTLTDASDPWAHRLHTLRSRPRPGSTRLPLTAMGTADTRTAIAARSSGTLPVEALAGPCPRHARAVGEAMRNRLLVLSTLDDPPPTPSGDRMRSAVSFGNDDDGGLFVGEEEGGVDEADEWGYAAAEEAARLYSAGPVIDLSGDADEDTEDDEEDKDEEDKDEDGDDEEANGGHSGLVAGFDAMMTWRDLEQDLMAHPRKTKKKTRQDDGSEEGGRVLSKKQRMKLRSPSYLRLLQEKEAAAVATAPPAVTWLAEPTEADKRDTGKDDDGADDEEEGKWQEGARRRHRRIARAVADWLDMLPVFGYLP